MGRLPHPFLILKGPHHERERPTTMSNVFDLDSLREELDRQFAPVTFKRGGDTFTLRNLMRVGKKERTQVIELMNRLQAENIEKAEDAPEDPEQIERVQDLMGAIVAAVTAEGKGSKLLESIGDDLQLLSKIMELWQEATKPGEADDSPES